MCNNSQDQNINVSRLNSTYCTPYETSGSGDGTVPIWSCLDTCKKMGNQEACKEYPEKFESIGLNGVDHVSLLFSDVVMKKIYEAVGLESSSSNL